ncbi:peptide/nickel transport system substrate-binding protein [Pseudorhodoplanes sinuspersici]|nr:peptide/nickel transport system substrate-binding protein [Pseudorhodoplanes sinuspersici]
MIALDVLRRNLERSRLRRWRALAVWMIAFGSAIGCQAANAEPQHAIAMHGAPAMPRDFSAMPYVNPDAPKGGRIVHGVLGTFDSLNPMIVKGLSIPQIRGYVIEGLMARGYNEPFTLYGLVAETIETDDKRSFITFNLNPKARFSDGHPVTPDDVVFSWQLLRDKGRPNYRTYYSKVSRVDITGPHSVRFDLSGSEDRELPLILGLMPVLPKHAIDVDRFEDTTFTPPIGSGPYIVKTVDPGRSVTLVRNPDYWGAKLPINRGLWNVDEIKADFYRDDNSYFEAFKKGLYDMRAETDPTRWQTGYDTPAYRAGRYVKEAFHDGLPKGMNALVFNTRRPVFADIRVREAIAMLFDFEWINKNFFFNLQKRTGSYFEGSELSSLGRPADERERDWLKSYPGAVRDDVLEGRYMPPKTNGSGRDREVLKNALTLFEEAGYELDGTVLRKRDTGQALTFEILVTSRDHERLALAFARDLKRAGITVQIRTVDAVQFDRRRLTYDFDMIPYRWDESLSPGNEQSFYWGSAAADIDGTRNYMGVKSPAIDAMIAHLLQARERDHFVSAVRALDRILISGFYVVPLFHLPDQWVARWTRIEHPKTTPLFGYLPEAWWHNPGAR